MKFYKSRRKADRKGLKSKKGKLGREKFDALNQIEKSLTELIDPDHLRGGEILESLDAIEDVLERNEFNSDQVDHYYYILNKGQTSKTNISVYLKTLVSFILFFASLYLLIADIPPTWKGVAIFYFNFHDALTMSDLFGITLFFISSLLFITQMVKLFK